MKAFVSFELFRTICSSVFIRDWHLLHKDLLHIGIYYQWLFGKVLNLIKHFLVLVFPDP